MSRDRSTRRRFLNRAKERARFIGRYIWRKFSFSSVESPIPPGEEDPRIIGVDASTHCKKCSSPRCCGNPRRLGEITNKERLAELSEQEQLNEFYEDEE